MTRTTNGNALLLHGGGLCPDSNMYLSTLAEHLQGSELFEKVLMGFCSFECLIKPDENIKEWNPVLKDKASRAFGGFYQTHRTVNLANPELLEIALKTCADMGIKWIFVAGGDGSSRQVAEIAEAFEANGVKFCIPMPLTVDGIEGGQSLGVRPAAAMSLYVTELLAATNLMTKDSDAYSVCAVEVQGRNRDDILANLLKLVADKKEIGGIPASDIDVIALPCNYEWNWEDFYDRVVETTRRTLVLYSEGAAKKKDIKGIFKCQRKVRGSSVGYLCQISDKIDKLEKDTVRHTVQTAMPIIQTVLPNGKSFCVVYESLYSTPRVEPIGYYAELNPKEGQKPTLAKELEALVRFYMP